MRFSEYLKKVSGDFHVAIKVEWLNYDETVLYEFTNDIYDINASVSVNYNQGARRSCTLLLNNDNNKFPINFNGLWIGQKFKLWMGIYFDNETPYLLPQGVFFVSNPDEAYNPSERTVTINGVDKWAWIDGTLNGVLTGTHKTPVGANLYDAIKGLLSSARVPTSVTTSNIQKWFDVDNQTNHFVGKGGKFTAKISHSQTAKTVLTAKYDCNVQFSYSYKTEANYEHFLISAPGISFDETGHGSGSMTVKLNVGDKISFTHNRDSSDTVPGYEGASFFAINLMLEGVVDRNSYDPTPPLLSPSFLRKTTIVNEEEVPVYKCPYTVVTERGKTIADVLLEYATILCANVYYDVHGRLVLEPMIDTADDLTDTNKEIDWHYTVDEKTFLGLRQSYNFTNVYNDILVLGNVANGYQFKGRVQNNNPLSDTSISKIGLKSKPPIEDNQYVSDTQCVELAKYYAKMDTIMQKSGTIDSTLLFHLDVNHIVTVSTPNNNMSKEMFLITGFNLSSQGKMSVNVTSINVLKDFSVVEVV